MKLRWFGALLLAAFLATAAGAAAERVRVELMPSKQPVGYLQFDKDTLRVAATEEGLAQARPLKAVDGPGRWDVGAGVKATAYEYLPVPLPVLPPGVDAAKARFEIARFSAGKSAAAQWEADGTFQFSARDTAGARWTYTVEGSTPGFDPDTGVPTPDTTNMPVYYDLASLVPKVAPQVKGHQVGLELELMAVDPKDQKVTDMSTVPSVVDFERNGQPAPARMEVRDAKGKVISAKNGTVEAFAGGWSGPNYSVRVAKKGTYTAKATVQTPNGARTAEAKFTVK